MRQIILGVSLIAVPVGILFLLCAHDIGWLPAITLFVGFPVLCGSITTGGILLLTR